MGRLLGVFILMLCLSCQDPIQPKPSGFLALKYEKPQYNLTDLDCPYQFEKNKTAEIEVTNVNRPCWITLDYSRLNAKIYLTYTPVHNNLRALLIDAQKLPEKHTIKADMIEYSIYQNDDKRTFGNFYEVEGDAASQAQFYLTDSTSHFLTGSIYFEAKPNYDSILPAAAYMKSEMQHLMETLEWK
ncbi:gliding motility lipoprotein GldD [Psychroflexus tropicus]|uniref:gliding motility lipoprotein GldD n=1 Tax=Psychroflexus tropicus TaxID=197345 RepID=UPI00039A2F14|nr:gliding motility lipoprotein GldD [Psychroflexus tropicus]